MFSCRNKLLVFSIFLLQGFWTEKCKAQTWQAGTSDWNTVGNWTTANVPDTNIETATFSSTGNTSVDLSADTTIQALVFGAGSQAYTIGSATGKKLTIDLNTAAGNANAITTTTTSGAAIMNNALVFADSNAGGGTAVVLVDVGLGSSLTLNGNITSAGGQSMQSTSAGTLYINGNVNLAGGQFQQAGTGTIYFNPASFTSGGGLRSLTGTGKLFLMSDFTVGTLVLGSASALNPLGNMDLGTAGMSMSRNVSFVNGSGGGTGTLTFGADMTSGGTATLAGSVALSVGSGASTLTNNLDATDANDTLNITSVISGTVTSGTVTLQKTGNGTVILGGTSANTFSGQTVRVAAGTLALNKTAGLDAITNTTVTVNSGGILRWDASNQINNSASMVMNGGTLNFNGQSETMGTLGLTANSSLTFGSGTEAIVFADSSAQNWGAFVLTINSFTNGVDTLRYGASNSGLTAAQLSLLSFFEFGGVGGQIDVNGFVTPLANNSNVVISSSYTGTQNVTQNGTGSITLTGANTSTGTATVTSGTLIIGTSAGGNWAGNVIANGGILKGRGVISGNLTINNGALYSPGNSPGIQQVGSLTVNSGGTLLIEVDGGSAGNGFGFYDQVQSVGAAILNGGILQGQTIFSGSSGFHPSFGTKINFLTASSVTGKFDSYDFSSNNVGQSWMVEYRDTEVNLFAVPSDWERDIVGLNVNQKSLGRALQSFAPTALDARGSGASGLISTYSDQGKIFNGLMRLDNGGLKTAFDELSPEKLTAMSSSVVTLSSIGNGGATQRLNQIRRGDKGVSLNGLSLRTMDGDWEYESLALDQGAILVSKKKELTLNGFFVNTTGSYSEVDTDQNRIGFENRLGGVTAGYDREITSPLTVGAFASQGYADTQLNGGGNIESNSGRLGVYGGYHLGGIYFNTSLSGGLTSFDTKRKIGFLGETAEGSTQGYDLGGQVNTGVDFQMGKWVWGPTGKIDYGYQMMDQFREHGSAARLQVDNQNTTQLETGLGMRVSRPFDYKGWKWIPEIHLLGSYQWYEPGKIRARFDAGGDSFTIRPESAGQVMIIPGTGLSLYLDERNSLNFSYEARVNEQSLAHQLDVGWLMKF
ncbi:MAG: autotransporter domain-containing protein [Verrucomicrobiota bacterium]